MPDDPRILIPALFGFAAFIAAAFAWWAGHRRAVLLIAGLLAVSAVLARLWIGYMNASSGYGMFDGVLWAIWVVLAGVMLVGIAAGVLVAWLMGRRG